ncbi:MAG: TetR/AcrR family transcriptional regulator [Candidatus Cloacimonetes bacterium]|nr:TetR/AcrR family transcriptional regulator [Candidatus Cloacimonadota bacterium]
MSNLKTKRKEILENLMQEEIYEAAIELLLEKSIEDITMAEISKKTGVSRPTLYRYVNGKEGLIEFVGEKIGGSLLSKLQEVAAYDIEATQKLKLFITQFLTTFHKKEKILSILMRQGEPCGNSEEELEMHKLFDDSMAQILTEIRHGKEQSEDEIFLQVQLIYGTISGLIEKAAISKTELDIPKVSDYLMKLFLNGLNY